VLSPYDHEDFAQLLMAVTAERVGAHFGAPEPGRVTITPAPALAALVVVVRDRLFGGVTRSTGADPHGKTLSSHLLDLRVPWFDRSAPMSSSARLEGRPN
jgi:hypothetical protein